MKDNRFPPGWSAERVQKVLAHYDDQTEDQGVAEDEAAFSDHPETVISVPVELIPAVRELISKQSSAEG